MALSPTRAAAVACCSALLGFAPRVGAQSPVRPLELRAYVGYHDAGYSTLAGGSEAFFATRGSLGATLWGPLQLRADGLFGRLPRSDALAGAGALRLYYRGERYVLGAAYGRTWLTGGLESETLALHGEVREAEWLIVSSSFGVERRNLGDDVWFAEVFTRLYPSPSVLLSPGVSYAVSTFKQTRADIILRAEWRLFQSAHFSPALFVQYGGNNFTKGSAGVTVYFDELDYSARERQDALFAARFD